MARTSVVPDLIDALVAALDGVVDATVSDTWPDDLNTGDRVVIGVEDLDGERSTGATSRQSWPHASKVSRDEEGEIFGAIFCAHGDLDAKGARDAAYVMSGQIETILRADVTVGVSGVLWTSYSPDRYTPYRTAGGVACAVYFTIAYRARL